MNRQGEIIIVDDDDDDCELLKESLQRLGIQNKTICFSNPKQVLDYLHGVDSDPFMIFSDLRMPVMSGFELRRLIYADADLAKKAIPFVVFSLTNAGDSVSEALSAGVQGFFVKPISLKELDELLSTIIGYFQKGFGQSVSTASAA